jgi:hypothetical protein
MGFDRRGYFFGWLIAIACVSLFFWTGMKYQEIYNTPKPCIRNFKDVWFGQHIQNMLRDDEKTFPNSDVTPRDMAISVIEYGDEPASLYTIELGETKIEYYVPSYCYAEDGFFEPTLWRKD